ncbi:bis-aminopropyl spermidine synthase family protein [Kutzneria kofuensis]|uniref:N(4)-bis(aminopropyl)spermidine synthase C-terminal domain-containing protein n=1 Tax=Kutzneria kofuensis TaxID=103725 RepID=A0A7W9NHJ1_9PSEU|nr:bis-aminopropyl spermidine synthase family protein [Kutzneria kofuensis]MBB5893617.1 hypothetical protein [Kutzneria kofuensis]
MTPLDQARAVVSRHGARTGPARRVIGMLCDGPHTLAELVRESAVPRRGVEELLSALDGDLVRNRDTYEIRAAAIASYTEAFTVPPRMEPDLDVIRSDVDAVPPPLAALDHVQATPETVARRAKWLNEQYELSGNTLLCLGDHDLTSLAVAAVNPDVEVIVVDLDDRVLAHIDTRARERGLNIRCLHADLRFGLPPTVMESSDLVFSDPPYTPEGMALFAGRGVEALRDTGSGRLLLAYGFSDRTPALGQKVQQELLGIGLVFEAILPGFHRFDGAQAIGSAADLYVCQATSRGRKAAQRTGIYTHGPQSIESSSTVDSSALLAFTGDSAAQQPDWTQPITGRSLTIDASADPGPWLLRILLACNAEKLSVLVPNNHVDVRDERGQKSLSTVVASKYRLRFHRSTPDGKHAVVVATRTGTGLLDRVHGKLGNILRETMIAESGGTLTKREARELVAAKIPGETDLRLIDLPRHRIEAIVGSA